MFIEERYNHILTLLEQNGKVLVKDLSKTFNVSESMIRKDLQLLEKKNLLQRTYGGAISVNHKLVNIESFQHRILKNQEIKHQIAQKSLAFIEEEDTIFLDASTTSYMIAKSIIAQDLSLTLITNMTQIASLIPTSSKVKFIFIGGDYNPLVGGCIGSYAIEQIKAYRCTKAFMGCGGIDLSDGTLSTPLSEDAATKKAIMGISKQLYLVTSNQKFETNCSYNFAHIMDVTQIITECTPSVSILSQLKEYNIPMG